jgi:hypothetical protein
MSSSFHSILDEKESKVKPSFNLLNVSYPLIGTLLTSPYQQVSYIDYSTSLL